MHIVVEKALVSNVFLLFFCFLFLTLPFFLPSSELKFDGNFKDIMDFFFSISK